jgi:glutathione S-transferase
MEIFSEDEFEAVPKIQKRTRLSFDEIMDAIKRGLADGTVVGKQFSHGDMYTYPGFKAKRLFDY